MKKREFIVFMESIIYTVSRVISFILIPLFFIELVLKHIVNFFAYKKALKKIKFEGEKLSSLVNSQDYDPEVVYSFFQKELLNKGSSYLLSRMDIYFRQNGALVKMNAIRLFFNKRKFIDKIIWPNYYYPNQVLRKSLRHLKKTGEMDETLHNLIKYILMNITPLHPEVYEDSFEYKEYILELKSMYRFSKIETLYLDQFLKTNNLDYLIKFLELPTYLHIVSPKVSK